MQLVRLHTGRQSMVCLPCSCFGLSQLTDLFLCQQSLGIWIRCIFAFPKFSICIHVSSLCAQCVHAFICILSHLTEGGLDPSKLSRTSSGLLCQNTGISAPLNHPWRACLQGKSSPVMQIELDKPTKMPLLHGGLIARYTCGKLHWCSHISLNSQANLTNIVSPVSSL